MRVALPRRLTVGRPDPDGRLADRDRGRRRRLEQLGPAELDLTLRYDPQSLRRRPALVERELTRFLSAHHVAWLLRELKVSCVLDVGANVGQFAETLRGHGYRGQIVSFEPLPHLVAVLGAKAAQDPAWRVMPFAVGETEGTFDMHVRDGTLSSLLPSSDFGRGWSQRMRASRTETIEVRRLDAIWQDAVAGLDEPRVYLKLDTQGFDLRAFRGAGDRVGSLLGLQSEVSCLPIYEGMPSMTEQLAAYQAAGFQATGMFPVSRHRPTLRVIEFDVVMVGPRWLAERG